MLRAALKRYYRKCIHTLIGCPDTHNAACGIETPKVVAARNDIDGPDTHNAACGINNKMALRVLSVTQSRFRMRKAHSNLDDAAHRC